MLVHVVCAGIFSDVSFIRMPAVGIEAIVGLVIWGEISIEPLHLASVNLGHEA